ncbi:MAG: hypothetical protein QXQ14_00550 [Candidatus Aenigmatarchaeota archaeon]
MDLEKVFKISTENYVTWKKLAEEEKDFEKKAKYYKKALFWLEVYMIAKEIENSNNEKIKEALAKKLSNYLEEVLKDFS